MVGSVSVVGTGVEVMEEVERVVEGWEAVGRAVDWVGGMAEGLVVKEMEVKVRVGLEMKVEEKAAGGSEEKGRAAGLVEVERRGEWRVQGAVLERLRAPAPRHA